MTIKRTTPTKWDLRFLNMARLVSTWSKDPSTQTGAVVVRPNKSVASVGFNGFPQKMPDKKEWYENRNEKYSRIVHCEKNAIRFSRDEDHEGYTLYTWPFISCDRCFVEMAQEGIVRFVAPVASPEQLTRWGPVFELVRQYAKDMNVELVEVPRIMLGLEE